MTALTGQEREGMRPNVFAGPHVDRLKFANADAESVARAIAEGSARLIPVWKSRCPVVRLPSPGRLPAAVRQRALRRH